MKTNTLCRPLVVLLLSILLCLALGGAWAEEPCIHMEMKFTFTNGSSVLTQSCPDCGHTAILTLAPQVFEAGTDYEYVVTVSGKDPWDDEMSPLSRRLEYYSSKPDPFTRPKDENYVQPTSAGKYYASFTVCGGMRVAGELIITEKGHQHNSSYASSNNAITASCGCGLNSTLTLNMSSTNAGEAQPATLSIYGTWPESTLPKVAYYDAAGNPLSALPQEAGDYYAAITVTANGENYIATKAFTLSTTVIEPANVPADRIISDAPVGMAFASKTIEDGQYHMVISQKDTDWGNVVAQLFDTQRQMLIWQTPHIVPYPDATRYAYISASSTSVDAAVKDLLNQSSNVHISMIGGNATLAMRNLGSYTPESGLFIPGGSDSGTTFVIGWYKDGKLIAIELLKESVTFDDDTPFTIAENKLGAANILPAVNLSQDAVSAMEIVKDDGSVSYRADSTGLLNASVIETSVLLPQSIAGKAAACEIRYDAFKDPLTVQIETIGGKPGIVITSDLPANGSARGYSYALTFKDAQGNFVKAYNLTVSIRMGEPVPFPLYHEDWDAVPTSCIQLQTSSESGSVPAGLSLSYDAQYGIVNYNIDPRALPRDRSLDGVLGTVHILPPEGAKAYRMYPPFESGISVRPDMYSMSNDDSLHAEERIAQSPLTTMNGFFGRNIEFPFLQGHEVNLIDGHPYTLYDLGLPNMGELGAGFRLIYWYADEAGEELLSKQYLLVTCDPASAPAFTTPVLDESELGAQSAAYPRVIISRETENGERYLFYSDVVPQTSDNELHYELRLTDAQGTAVSTQTLRKLAPLTIYVPVPDGVDAYDPNLTFTVSHLNANSTKVTETFSIENKTLQLTEYGLAFTVDSLSPFVLSWDNAAADTSQLPQTGDSSPALPMLAVFALISTGYLFRIARRKRIIPAKP